MCIDLQFSPSLGKSFASVFLLIQEALSER